jgi:hypothetical protein
MFEPEGKKRVLRNKKMRGLFSASVHNLSRSGLRGVATRLQKNSLNTSNNSINNFRCLYMPFSLSIRDDMLRMCF